MKQIRYATVDTDGNIARTGTCVADDMTLQVDETIVDSAVVAIPPETTEVSDTTHRFRFNKFEVLE